MVASDPRVLRDLVDVRRDFVALSKTVAVAVLERELLSGKAGLVMSVLYNFQRGQDAVTLFRAGKEPPKDVVSRLVADAPFERLDVSDMEGLAQARSAINAEAARREATRAAPQDLSDRIVAHFSELHKAASGRSSR